MRRGAISKGLDMDSRTLVIVHLVVKGFFPEASKVGVTPSNKPLTGSLGVDSLVQCLNHARRDGVSQGMAQLSCPVGMSVVRAFVLERILGDVREVLNLVKRTNHGECFEVGGDITKGDILVLTFTSNFTRLVVPPNP
jgi:hypothetical protein